MPIITWKNILDFITAKGQTTKKEIYAHFNHNANNLPRKLRSLSSHRLIKIRNDIIIAL